ncbi:MAG: divalent metal cation transporter [Crenarchaeota archaeon]|nr:MAG: divalent metal cation transporter [Thermoproteota archaeon]RDJ34008.1 MAG: divalent metal cation transporter [Thermoproteota archaeon]RDJ36877.1 MAG: divalent metal cation transporter [Thermoproteota archaeon]
MKEKYSRLLKTLGPGILFASTAIGVSHLIQSTRAGAEYGFLLLGIVLIANLLKYPFFEYGSRYANVTGTSIIDGYQRLERKALLLYFFITIGSMFFVTAAVGFVTAGFLENLFQIEFLGVYPIIILFAVCVTILSVGKYRTLDSLIKIIGSVLVVSTVIAFALVLINGPIKPEEEFIAKEIWSQSGIFFLIALMGWMPTAIDLSSWNSLWTLERIKQTNFKPTLKETLLEFRIGYIITAVLAVFFVTLGAFIFYGTTEDLPNDNSMFAHKVVTLYTTTIGEWSYIIIAASAFSVMFGTIIAVLDGYSRSLHRTVTLLWNPSGTSFQRYYVFFILILSIGSLIVVFQFQDNLKLLVDFATTLSFLIAPVIAIFNFKLVTGKYLTKDSQPPLWLKILSYAGIVFLIGFAAFFVITRF